MTVEDLKTCEFMQALSPEQQLEMTKEAKGGSWDPKWRPYCTQEQVPCSSGRLRMDRMNFGFRCRICGNIIGFDLTRLKESPLNDKNYQPPVPGI